MEKLTFYPHGELLALYELEREPSTEEEMFWEKENPFLKNIANSMSELSCTVRLTTEAFNCLTGVLQECIRLCTNRRVKHLALHARKHRTRKKNQNRMYKILERSEE